MKNKLGKKLSAAMLIPFCLIFMASIAYIAYMTLQYVTDRTELEILKAVMDVTVMPEGFDISVKGSERTVTALFDQDGIIHFSSDSSYIGKNIPLSMDSVSGDEPIFLANEYSEMLGGRAFVYSCPVNLWKGLTVTDDIGKLYLYVAAPRSAIFNDLISPFIAVLVMTAILLAVVFAMGSFKKNQCFSP